MPAPQFVYVNPGVVKYAKITLGKKYKVIAVNEPEIPEGPVEDVVRPSIYDIMDDAGEIVSVFSANCLSADDRPGGEVME